MTKKTNILKKLVGESFYNNPQGELINKRYQLLAHEGYRPDISDDGDLVFKFEGKTYILSNDMEDPDYFRLILPQFCEAKTARQQEKMLYALNETNAHIKMLKIYVNKANQKLYTSMAYETYCNNYDLVVVLNRGLGTINQGLQYFINSFQEQD